MSKLCNGDWVKINIHFNVQGTLLNFCEKINYDINQHSFGSIHLGVKNITMPHISIYTGYIDSFEQFELIFQEVSEYANKTKPFRIDPTQLYLKSIIKILPKYLFLDILQNQEIIKQKKYFCELFKNSIKPIEWDFISEPPHIMLGYYMGLSSIVNKQIAKYHKFPYCEIEEIGISIYKNKSVYLGNLKSFKLNKNI